MNDHHLDDLIIGDPEPGGSKSKTLLTIIALLVVVLIFGLILWALLFDPSSEEVDKPDTSKQEKPLTPDQTHSNEPNNGITINKPKLKPIELTPVKTTTPAPKPVTTKLIVKPKLQLPQKTNDNAVITKKPTETKQKSKNTQIIRNSDKTVYFIQVGAFKRNPDPRFIKKLKENGYTFITKTSNGIRRVRVGPFDGYEEAKKAIPDIKAKLGVDGLIIKY